MFAVLPLFCWALLWLCLIKRHEQKDFDFREKFLIASLAWATYLVISTEFLSLLRWLNFLGVLGAWTIATIGLIVFYYKIPGRKIPQHSFSFKNVLVSDAIFLSGIFFIILIVALIAWVAPPNNWDSLTYHMGRVAHWVQNQTLANYPTGIPRQVTHAPGAEYIILHFQILCGSDRLANFVQWYAMVASIIMTSLIAKKFGASLSGQILTGLITATIPMGILQGSSTQNDYVLTFWLTCFVYFFIRYLSEKNNLILLGLGISAGLSILTKGTAFLVILPFIFWIIFSTPRTQIKQTLKLFIVLGLCFVILNTYYLIRKYNFYQNVQDLFYETKVLRNERHDGTAFVSNLARNCGLHLGTPLAPLNHLAGQAISGFHKFFSININDPQTSSGEYLPPNFDYPFHEDQAGNTLHFLLGLLACVLLLGFKKWKHNRIMTGYAVAIIVSFLLFNFIFKWQLWNARLHLPFFVLFAPVAGTVFSLFVPRKIHLWIGGLLFVTSLPWIFLNESRPLFKEKNIFNTPRIEQYFANNPGFYFSYERTVASLKESGCSDIGLFFGADTWEYPLWVLFKEKPATQIRMEYIWVPPGFRQKSCPYPLGPFMPCAIIEDKNSDKTQIVFDNVLFFRVKETAFLRIFVKDEKGVLSRTTTLSHFHRVLLLSAQEMKLQNASIPSPEKIMTIKKEILQEAQFVSSQDLNQIYPDLGDQFKKNFIGGTEGILKGFENKDEKEYTNGLEKVSEWQTWLKVNQDALQKILSPISSSEK